MHNSEVASVLEGTYFRQLGQIVKWQLFVTYRSREHPISLCLFLILVTLLLINVWRILYWCPKQRPAFPDYPITIFVLLEKEY